MALDARGTRTWGSIAISVIVVVTFAAALVYAYVKNDATNTALLIGAIVAQFSQVVSYWVGSSAGGQQKDDIIAQSVPPVSTVSAGTDTVIRP